MIIKLTWHLSVLMSYIKRYNFNKFIRWIIKFNWYLTILILVQNKNHHLIEHILSLNGIDFKKENAMIEALN